MEELENHHFATVTVITGSCKAHPRMLKVGGRNLMKSTIVT